MIQLGVTALILAPTFALLAPRSRAVNYAIAASLSLFILIPPQGPPFWLVAATPGAVIVTGAIVLLRVRHRGALTGLGLFVAAVAWAYTADLRGADASAHYYAGLLIGAFAVFGLLLGRSSGASLVSAAVLAWNLPIQAAWALLEQMQLVGAMWPRGSTFDLIFTRVQTILPFLPGRSMGSVGHPILLGLISAVGISCAIFLARTVSKRYWALAIVGVIPLLLSGTRSAVAALIFSLAVGLLTSLGKGWATAVAVWMALGVTAAVVGGALDSILNPDVASSASFVHRLSVLESALRLLGRPIGETLFGSGGDSLASLFASGVVQGFEGLLYFDNQWIRSLALSGIIGVALLAAVFIAGLRRSNLLRRFVLIQLLVMTFSFDIMTWPLAVMLLAVGSIYDSSMETYEDRTSSMSRESVPAVRTGENARE